jgi:hypothetical protein
MLATVFQRQPVASCRPALDQQDGKPQAVMPSSQIEDFYHHHSPRKPHPPQRPQSASIKERAPPASRRPHQLLLGLKPERVPRRDLAHHRAKQRVRVGPVDAHRHQPPPQRLAVAVKVGQLVVADAAERLRRVARVDALDQDLEVAAQEALGALGGDLGGGRGGGWRLEGEGLLVMSVASRRSAVPRRDRPTNGQNQPAAGQGPPDQRPHLVDDGVEPVEPVGLDQVGHLVVPLGGRRVGARAVRRGVDAVKPDGAHHVLGALVLLLRLAWVRDLGFEFST